MNIKSSADILFYIKKISVDKNVNLSPKMCAFFISLIQLFVDEAIFDGEKNLYYVQYSFQDFSDIFSQYSFNLIVNSMKQFEMCGLIQRVPVKREFCKLFAGEYTVNMPYLTYLDLSLFIKD